MRVAIFTVLGVCLHAADFESLHIFNFNFQVRDGVTLQLHTRGRTFEDAGAYNQFRAGPILMWQALPRFTVLSGYYNIDQAERGTHVRTRIHRIWSGGQYRLLTNRKWSLDGRSLAERFHAGGQFQDYWRMRNRLMATRNLSFGNLYASAEALRQQDRFYGRYTAGVQWRVQKRVTFGTGYEFRDAVRGPGSHIFATFFQWEAYQHTPPHVD